MKALVKRGAVVSVQEVPCPAPRADEVLVRVGLAGLCRTDLYVADGRLPGADPVILGHECAGTIVALGEAPGAALAGAGAGLAEADRVTIHPLLPCGDCPACRAATGDRCARPSMLGVRRDGAFAEYLLVPARACHVLPAGLSLRQGAYCEPVAAAMAVLHAGLRPHDHGLLHGAGRIARLTERVLRAHGFDRLTLHDPQKDDPPPESAFDFAIETQATQPALAEIIRATRPQGTVVLKSRPPQPVPLDVHAAVLKDLTLRAVSYAPFPAALALLAGGRLPVDDLLGPAHALEDFHEVFAAAQQSEAAKLFFQPSPSR